MALGSLHDQRGDRAAAETYYRRALEIDSEFAPAANNLAWLLASSNRNLSEALKLANLAAGKMPKDPRVTDTLGWIYYLDGNYPQAVENLQRSLKLDPENALTNYHLGLAYYRIGRYDQARDHLKKALTIDPDFEGAVDARTMLDE
jgi:Flp pilus assembly protein TadD